MYIFPCGMVLTYWLLRDLNESLEKITFNLNLLLDGWSILYQITLKYMLLDLTDPNWTKYS